MTAIGSGEADCWRAERISCTSYRNEGDNQRVRETLVYACALAGSEDAERMLASIVKMHDHKGDLTVTFRPDVDNCYEKYLAEAWEAWGNELAENVHFEHSYSWRGLADDDGCS